MALDSKEVERVTAEQVKLMRRLDPNVDGEKIRKQNEQIARKVEVKARKRR